MINNKWQKLPLSICTFTYYLLPLPVAWWSVSLMSMYMKYYDIGVNQGANNGFLLFFIAPVLLAIFYIISTLSIYTVKRVNKSQWLGMACGSAMVFVVGIIAFVVFAHSNLDYPTEKPQDIILFLKYYACEARKYVNCFH